MRLIGTRRGILQSVQYFAWDDAKNGKLRKERGIGFEDGLPYRTLISSLLHKYAAGRLKEV